MGNKNSFKEKFPKFIQVLVFTELWERFSFYSMRMILVLYMTIELRFEDQYAYGISALQNAFAFYLPIITGYLADKQFGFINMLISGGLVVIFGHVTMFFGMFTNVAFYIGTTAVAVGTGFFRGNILNLLGASYDSQPNLDRVSGFTLFYASVNLGAFSAAISSGYLSTYISYHFAFSLAGIGMALGLFVFYKYRSLYDGRDVIRRPEFLKKKVIGNLRWPHLLFFCALALVAPAATAIYFADVLAEYNIVYFFCIPVIVYIIYAFFKLKNTRDRKNYTIVLIYLIFLMFFFAYELQLGSLFPLFVQRNVYKFIGPVPVPAAIVQSINPGVIMIVGFCFSLLSNRNRKYDLLKIAIGISANTVCFLILHLGTLNANPETAEFSYLYPIVGVFCMASGEVLMSPLVQSATTTYSPKGMKGIMMGIYLCLMGFASLAGFIFANIFSVPPNENGDIDPFVSLEVYKNGFRNIALFNLIFLGAFILCVPLLLWLQKVTPEEKLKMELEAIGTTKKQDEEVKLPELSSISQPNTKNAIEV